MGPSKVLTTLLLQIQKSWQLSLLELPPSCVPARNTVTLSTDSSDMYTSTVQFSPSSANAALQLHPRLQAFYPPSAHFVSSSSAPSLAPSCPSTSPASSLPLTISGFFNGILEVFEPEALNYSTFFCPTLLTLSVSRNPILTPLPLSGFSALRSDRTHSLSGILSGDATHAGGGVIIFVRQGLSFSELSTSSLSSLDPYSDYVGINISLLTTPPRPHFLMCTPPPLFAPFRRMAEPTPFSPSILPSSRNLFILWDFNCHPPPLGLKRYFQPSRGGSIQLGNLF